MVTRDLGILPACLVLGLVLLTGLLGPSSVMWAEGTHTFEEESYVVTLHGEPLWMLESPDRTSWSIGGGMWVSHRFKVRSTSDKVERLNITIPYPLADLIPEYGGIEARTPDTHVLTHRVIPARNTTTVEITTPEIIYEGDDRTIILSYFLNRSLPSTERTYWDRVLGRPGNMEASMRAQRLARDTLLVTFVLPSTYIPKIWSPEKGMKKYDSHRNSFLLEWLVNDPDERNLEFSALYGVSGLSFKNLALMIAVGIGLFALLIYTSICIRNRCGRSQRS